MILYNELEPFAAAWLRNLAAAGHIAAGDVDERSIRDLKGADLDGRTQVHLFAGIGGWSYALRLAGWPDDAPVWTGSCPCQPFSSAGQKRGEEDERHLWPEMVRLVSECRPPTIFGEQVASDDGRYWLAGVRTDLEALGYAFGAADLCAASVGAPHIRQRLFWVAVAQGKQLDWSGNARRGRRELTDGGGVEYTDRSGSFAGRQGAEATRHGRPAIADGDSCRMGNTEHPERRAIDEHRQDEFDGADGGRAEAHGQPGACRAVCVDGLADTGRASDERGMRSEEARSTASPDGSQAQQRERRWLDPWGRSVAIYCGDGKARRVGPGVFPLAHGVPSRVGRLRAYGNAIVPQAAADFVRSVRTCQ